MFLYRPSNKDQRSKYENATDNDQRAAELGLRRRAMLVGEEPDGRESTEARIYIAESDLFGYEVLAACVNVLNAKLDTVVGAEYERADIFGQVTGDNASLQGTVVARLNVLITDPLSKHTAVPNIKVLTQVIMRA